MLGLNLDLQGKSFKITPPLLIFIVLFKQEVSGMRAKSFLLMSDTAEVRCVTASTPKDTCCVSQ